MKVIQINVYGFAYLDMFLDFLIQEQADIVLLQEVRTGILSKGDGTRDGLQEIADALNYHVAYGKKYSVVNNKGLLDYEGNAILSTFPFVEQEIYYLPVLGPHRIFELQDLGLHYDLAVPHEREAVRNLAQHRPSCFVDCVIDIGSSKIRVLTTHFTVSKGCKEIPLMVEHAEFLCKLLDMKENIPTLLGGDFNITTDSVSIAMLQEKLILVDDIVVNTLNSRLHPGFQSTIPPTGFHIDHLFQSGFAVQKRWVPEVDISDHLPIVAEINIL